MIIMTEKERDEGKNGKTYPVVDEAIQGIAEQIDINGIRNWLTIYKGSKGEAGEDIDDMFTLAPCNEWVCEKCGHLEFAPTDKPHNGRGKEECPGCSRKSFVQKTPPIEWLWPKLYLPEPCDLFDIYEEIYHFLKQHIVLQDEAMYNILIAWIISSWKSHRLQTIPYIQILGTIETGKTRLLELLNEFCYHSIMAVSITPAAISRLIDNYEATILIDQAEKLLRLNSESGLSLYSICLSGYRKGMHYTIADQNNPNNTISKNVFGPKAFTSERVFDPALTSRCVTIRMHRHEPLSKEIDYDWAQSIRKMLLYYRYKFDVWNGYKTILKGRVRELYSPLLQIVASGSKDTKIVENYARQQKQQKDAEFQTSDEAIILKTILDNLGVQERQLDVTELFISEIADITVIDVKRVGWRLKNLGIERKRSASGMYIEFTPQVILHLKQLGIEYGFLPVEGEKEGEKEER